MGLKGTHAMDILWCFLLLMAVIAGCDQAGLDKNLKVYYHAAEIDG